jgi:outer membrane protein assembly factor BamB
LVLEESLPMKHIRSFIRTSALVLCACFVSLGCGSVAWGQQAEGKRRVNCSEFHRPDMMRYNLHEHVLNVNNVGELQVKWSCNTGSAVDASPAVLNGVVYVGSADDPCTR